MTIRLNNEASGILNSAAKHLHATLHCPAQDIFVLDFTIISLKLKAYSRRLKTRIVEFCTHVKVKILREKNAYLVNKLTEDV